MSSWAKRTTRSGIEYGGNASQYYWNISNNAGATTGLCLANCTTYCYGRILEAGDAAPVRYGFPDAQYWNTAVINGWSAISYNFSDLEEGDILVWSGSGQNHVAVVEEVNNDPFNLYRVSESAYVNRDESLGLAGISAWMIANYPDEFFHYGIGTRYYGGAAPTYILKNPAHHGTSINTTIFRFFGRKNKNKRRVTHYV